MKAIITNALWLMLERVSLSLSGIFVSIYVARYLGPAQFGALNYLLATIAIVVPLVQLGADSIIFNRVARRQPSGIRLMLASIRLRRWLFGGDAADTDMELFQPIARQPTDDVVAACQRLFLDSGRVQDLLRCPPAVETQYADQQPGAAAVDRAAAGTGERRAAAGVVRGALHPQQRRTLLARLWLFRGEAAALPRVTPRQAGRYGRYLLKVGLPLAISSLSIVIYTRIDQIMLGNLVGEQAVGWFSAATTLSQGWVFVPMALITSLMPGIASCRDPLEQEYRIRVLYLVVLGLSLPVLLGLWWFAHPAIALLYGAAFQPAASILAICTLTSLFSVMGTVSYRSIVLFAGYRFIAIKMPLVAVANVVMNLLLIPRYGLIGAAVSTLLAEFISFFVLNSLFRGGKITRLQLTCFYCLPRLVSKLRREHVKHPG